MSKENTLNLMHNFFPKCPICKSDANFSLSAKKSGLFSSLQVTIVNCNECNARFSSNDFSDSANDLTKLSLFSIPPNINNDNLVSRLTSLIEQEKPIQFWQDFVCDYPKYSTFHQEYDRNQKKDSDLRTSLFNAGVIMGIPTIKEIKELEKRNLKYIMLYDQSLLGVFHSTPATAINILAAYGWKVVTMSTHSTSSGLIGDSSYMYVILEKRNEDIP